MKVFGKEARFKFTVGAASEIAKKYSDGDLNKLSVVLTSLIDDGIKSETMDTFADMIAILSREAEMYHKFCGNEYNDPLTVEEIKSLDFEDFLALSNEMVSCYANGNKITVAVDDKKANKGKNANRVDQ